MDIPFVQDNPSEHRQPERPQIALFEQFVVAQRVTADTGTNYRSLIWIYFSWLAARRNVPVLTTPTDAVLAQFAESVTGVTVTDIRAFRYYLRYTAY